MLSLGPFIAMGQIDQVIKRLFPFARGLTHYYWAGNIWALYMAFNKYALNLWKWYKTGVKVPMEFNVDDIQSYKFISLAATLIFLIVNCLIIHICFFQPLIVLMIRKMNVRNFNFFLAMTNFIVFNFGFHVHEKAILMILIPLM